MSGNVLKIGSNRIWTITGRAGPTHAPYYQAQGMLGALDWPQGDVTKIEAPSDLHYNEWVEVGSFQSSPERVTSTLTVYETDGRDRILDMIRQKCEFDIQIHKGICTDPRNFDGFEKVRVLPGARATSLGTTDQGALEGGNEGSSTEDLGISAIEVFDILRMLYSEVAQTQVGEEVIAVDICDSITCGTCVGQTQSDGCQKVFAVTSGGASSPGVKPQVIATPDAFSTIVESWISTMALAENASDAVCIGDYFVVISADGKAVHYADAGDILDGAATWTKVANAEGLNSIYNYSPLISFLAGEDGSVFGMTSPADALTTLDAAVASGGAELNEINGWDAENVAAVGATGVFVYSLDGVTFQAGTSPNAALTLATVAYRTIREIWTAGNSGNMYYTSDYGAHWYTKALPGTVTSIQKVIWANETVGFALATTASGAHVYRTINGGYSWYMAPENASMSVPAGATFNDIVACEPNKVFLGGIDSTNDGILIKGTD